MVSKTHANGSRERTQRTVALDQSALLEVLEVLKAADVDDRIRRAAQTIYQALTEAELTAVTGAAPHQRTLSGRGGATATDPECWPPRPVTWSCEGTWVSG